VYSDDTPDVTYGPRDRLGRTTAVQLGTNPAIQTYTYTYDEEHLQLSAENLSGLITRRITRNYADSEPLLGRPTGLSVGTEPDPDADYVAAWSYDAYGRLTRVTGPGLPAYGAEYTYAGDSNLVSEIAYKTGSSTTVGTVGRSFEAHRDVVTSVANGSEPRP
jgi:hypothetical protein